MGQRDLELHPCGLVRRSTVSPTSHKLNYSALTHHGQSSETECLAMSSLSIEASPLSLYCSIESRSHLLTPFIPHSRSVVEYVKSRHIASLLCTAPPVPQSLRAYADTKPRLTDLARAGKCIAILASIKVTSYTHTDTYLRLVRRISPRPRRRSIGRPMKLVSY